MVDKTKGRKEEVVTREYTINLHKRLHGWYINILLAICIDVFYAFLVDFNTKDQMLF